MNKEFRQDINGLRAWAVVAVILFHFGVPGFSGGFVGVDIFFVISGFLMTGIIYKGLVEQSFSLLNFYLARAKRIIPALLALCIVLLALGWQFLPSIEYKELGKHVFGAATFLSNIIFWQDVGYFDSASHEKWLLHTWSLSVEWQFYIILPLVLLAIWEVSQKKSTIITLCILSIFISLGLSGYAVTWKPSAAFYLLPTRAWEMLAGGLVFLLQKNITKNTTQLKALEILGFSCIITSIILFDSQTLWPGWKALLPTIGTCLVIMSKQSRSIFSTTKTHNTLGKWSYSLYLWHWPLVVFLNYTNNQNNNVWIIIGLLATIILGGLSYRFIESLSVNIMNRYSRKTIITTLILITLLVAITGLEIINSNGHPGRVPAHIEAVFDEQNNKNTDFSSCEYNDNGNVCAYGGKKVALILIGDSHANTMIDALKTVMPSSNHGFITLTQTGCPPIEGIMLNSNPRCKFQFEYAKETINKLNKNIPLLITSRMSGYMLGGNENQNQRPYLHFGTPFSKRDKGYFREYADRSVDSICKLAARNPVYITTPTPEFGYSVPKTMGRQLLLGREVEAYIDLSEYESRNKIAKDILNTAKIKCSAHILNTEKYLCNDKFCFGSKEGLPIYADDDHLSRKGASLLIPMLQMVLEKEI
ncbi:MAG: acyltransferase family protein [Oleispira sp.]